MEVADWRMPPYLAAVRRHDVLEQLGVHGHLRRHIECDPAEELARVPLRAFQRVGQMKVVFLLGLFVFDSKLILRCVCPSQSDKDAEKRTSKSLNTHVATCG